MYFFILPLTYCDNSDDSGNLFLVSPILNLSLTIMGFVESDWSIFSRGQNIHKVPEFKVLNILQKWEAWSRKCNKTPPVLQHALCKVLSFILNSYKRFICEPCEFHKCEPLNSTHQSKLLELHTWGESHPWLKRNCILHCMIFDCCILV